MWEELIALQKRMIESADPDLAQYDPERLWFAEIGGGLYVDAGYDHQNFILNLARSSCFPQLHTFAFGEYNEKYMELWEQDVTPFADYRELFASEAFRPVKHFVWRNPACSDESILMLKEIRPDLTLQIITTSVRGIL